MPQVSQVTRLHAARPPRRPTARNGPGTRLTRRGRVLLVAALAMLLLASFSLGRTRSDAASGVAVGAPVQRDADSTTVHAGDTLWSVAKRLAPQRDTREVVERIRVANHLVSAELEVGQQLLLPKVA